MNTNTGDHFIETLRTILSKEEVLTDSKLIATACTDWRKRYFTSALAIVTPKTVPNLQAVVKLCSQFKICITTQGGNTGLCGGSVPSVKYTHKPHIVLRTTSLRGPIQIDPKNLTLTVDAGYTLQEVQQAAADQGLLFPLSLSSEGSCTIGGNLASNAGGVAVLRYGNARELCLALEFINADGEVCGDLRALRKNNSGYDLRHLLIGSEGTLGIITRACLKVYPMPTAHVTVWINVRSLESAVNLLHAIQKRLFNELTSFEWMNQQAIALVSKHLQLKAPGSDHFLNCDHVLAEFSSLGSQETLRDQVENLFSQLVTSFNQKQLERINVFVNKNEYEANQFWKLRNNISEAQAKEGLNIKHDVACATSQLAEFQSNTLQAFEHAQIKTRPILFGHLGDGNLHFNLSAPEGIHPDEFLQTYQQPINKIVMTEIMKLGGTISAEHGIGQLRTEMLKQSVNQAHFQLFRTLKNAMDPQGLLNPGKIFD